ncbi:MAG: hypothetical protein K9H48_07970 [Melioribacteraceae bacterium]|nr:hypothetical protein [Melioribacteraceae bacterium]
MKIKIYGSKRKIAKGQIHPIERAKKELLDYDYQFVQENPDLIFLQKHLIPKDLAVKDVVKEKNIPIIILDDSASTGTHKFSRIGTENVIGCIKKQLLRKRYLYQFDYPRTRYHYFLISQSSDGNNGLDKTVRINNEITSLDNIHLGWNLGLMQRKGLTVSSEMDIEKLLKNRNLDIHYSVQTKHKTKVEDDNLNQVDDHYAYHRLLCSNKIEEIIKKYDLSYSGPCKRDRYLELMKQSKVCVSPWGLGEICFRDFEAISNGAILIKPDMSYLETWPNIFIPYKTYIPCNYDFSDLEEVVTNALNKYDKYKVIAINAFNALKQAWDNQIFAERFDEIMKQIKI